MIKCFFCSSLISDESRFCNFCGKDLSNIVHAVQCPKCYQTNIKGSIYCSWCGLDLSKEKILRAFTTCEAINPSAPPPNVSSASSQKEMSGINIAAILIFIVAGVFGLMTSISLWNSMVFGIAFDYAIHTWNVFMTIFEVYIGIKVLKRSKKGLSQGLWMSGVGVVWYMSEAIFLSWSIGYFLAILCVATFILLKRNEKLFSNQ